jgi:hypothetical protein
VTERTCSDCGTELPLDSDHFHKSARPQDNGFQHRCIACSRTRAARWQRENAERRRATVKLWRGGISIRAEQRAARDEEVA